MDAERLQLKIVTVSTGTAGGVGYDNWVTSARKLKLDFNVLGIDTKWSGFDTKTTLVRDYLNTISGNYVIAVVDCYDLIFNATCREEVEQRFFSSWDLYNSDIVIGVEADCLVNCYSGSKDRGTLNTSDFKYPNGGCVIGCLNPMRELYGSILQSDNTDDQYTIGKLLATSNPWNVAYDFKQCFVANIVPGRIRDVYFDDDEQLWKSQYSKICPLFLHTPNITADYASRYKQLLKKIHPELKLPDLHWFDHWQRVFASNWNNPCIVQIWVPALIGLILLPLIIGLSVALTRCQKKKRRDI